MLIPIGVVENEVRRTPWVSIGVLALLVLVFLAGVRGGVTEKQGREYGQALRRTVEFWVQHPWLRAPQGLEDAVGGELFEKLSRAAAQGRQLAERRRLVPVSTVVASQQERLDALFAEAGRALEARLDRGLSFVPARPEAKTLLTHQFLHGGFWHLLGNVLFLLVTAPFLEDVYGRLLFGALYLGGGAFAAGAHALATTAPETPLLGASGALAAVMGAFLIRLGRSHIRFLLIPILFMPLLRFRFALPAFVVLPLWFGEQVLSAKLLPDANVAWWAHIGGFVFGMAVAGAVSLLRVEERWINPAIEGEIGWTQDPALLKASEARSAGAFATARNSARAVLAKDPGNVDAWRSLLDTELASGRRHEAASAAARLLERYAATKEDGLAAALVEELREPLLDVLPARFFLVAASVRERAGDGDAACGELEELVARSPGDPAALRAAMRLADLARRRGSDEDALDLLAWAKGHAVCDAAFRATIERAEGEVLSASPSLVAAPRKLPTRRLAGPGEPRNLPPHAAA